MGGWGTEGREDGNQGCVQELETTVGGRGKGIISRKVSTLLVPTYLTGEAPKGGGGLQVSIKSPQRIGHHSNTRESMMDWLGWLGWLAGWGCWAGWAG